MNAEPSGWLAQLRWWSIYVTSWVLSSALALWLILQLRINLIDLNNALGWGPWILIGVDKFGFVLLGLGWLLGVFGVESYLRQSASWQRLLQRGLRTILVIGLALALSYLLQWLLV